MSVRDHFCASQVSEFGQPKHRTTLYCKPEYKQIRPLDKKLITQNLQSQQICFIPPTLYNHPCFQVPEGFSNPMVKREVGKVYTKSDAAPATVYK